MLAPDETTTFDELKSVYPQLSRSKDEDVDPEDYPLSIPHTKDTKA
jgi:hypothetical protein